MPLLLAVGALAGAGKLNLALCIALAVGATEISDVCWYELGRWRGVAILNLLCRISLEPDSCARRTTDLYARLGAKSLLVAKFVPGLTTVAPPLAGIFRMRLRRFLVFDTLGSLMWSTTFLGLGFIFSNRLKEIANYTLRFGEMLTILVVGGFAAYIAYKYIDRRKFLRDLSGARITPEELKLLLDSGEQIQIVDLRHSIEFEAEPLMLPGALRMDPKELEQRQTEIPRDRDIVLYCT
ncbi:MAG: VTT domain-containing protein [Candidatus Acidiferrales bacterium]